MAIVGSAEIVVRAITNQVKNDIQKGLRDALPAINKEGETAGKSYSDGFGKGSSSNLGKSFEDSLKRADLPSIANSAGENAGHSLGQGAERGIESEAAKLGSSAERAFSGAGKSGGDGFLKGFINSDFGKAAGQASAALTQLIGIGNTLGPGLAGLVSALSGAVSGLFAMGAAASQAAGALAVLPGTISVAAQAFGTLKLAFSGVSKAITAGFTSVTSSSRTSAATTISNARSIADARTALARANQAAATSLADATRKVADAENGVAVAQRATLAAQQGLNAAREQGVKDLRDLAFQAEDAGLAEQQSALDLQAARKKLQEAQALPPDDPARQAAELAFKQADLAYREAKARNQDLQAEEKKASKAGVDGTDAVITAKQKINAAQKTQAAAEKSLADARRSRQQTEIKNAQSVRDAQLRLTRAIQDQSTALAQGTSQANTYQNALAKLSPPAQAFVKHLVAMKPAFDALKAAAGAELFPKLTTGLDSIASTVFPLLQTQLRTTGGLIGQLGLDFASTISQGEGFTRLQQILSGNNSLLKVFTDRTKTGRSTLGNFVLVAERLLVVIQPITKRFFEWIRSLSVLAAQATNTTTKMDKFRKFLKGAGDTAAQLGRIFHNIIDAILILGGASKKSGQGLLDSFEQATKHLDKFLTKLRHKGDLQDFFKRAAFNTRKVGDLLDAIFVQLAKLGGNKNGGRFAESLIPAVKIFGDISNFLTDASPKLGPLATQLGHVIKQLTSPGQTKAFLGTLTNIVKAINRIFHVAEDANGFIKDHFNVNILKIVGIAFAIHRALAFAFVPLKFFGEALIGGPRNVLAGLTKVQGAFKGFKTGGFKGAFDALTKGSDKSKAALEKQMEVDKLKTESLKNLGKAAQKAAIRLQEFKDAAAPLAGDLEKIGKEAAAGLTLGFESGSDNFIKAMVTLAKESVQAIKVELGIASPSKVFEEIGREAGQGYVLGLESEEAKAAAAGSQLGTASAAGAKESSALGGVGGTAKAGATVEKDAAKAEGPLKSLAKTGLGLVGLGGVLEEGFGAMVAAAAPVIAIIVAIIAALVGLFFFFKELYKHSPQFKKFIDGIVGKLKEFWDWIKKVTSAVGRILGAFFVNDVFPLFDKFFKVVNDVMPKVGHIIGDVFQGIVVVWNTVLHPVFNAIIDIVKFLWKYVIKPYFTLIAKFIETEFKVIKFVVTHILIPVIKIIIDIIKFLWKNVFQPYFKLIAAIVKTVFQGIKLVWDSVLHPVFTAIGTAISAVADVFKSVFDKIKGLWDTFVSDFKTFKSDVTGIVDTIKGAFSDLGSSIGNAFKGLGKFAAGGLNSFINFLNNNLISKVNSVTSHFGFSIDKIPTINLAKGGKVTGPGGEEQDRVLARLSNNEFVVKAKSAKAIGYDALDVMNKTGQMPMGGLGWPHPHIPSFGDVKSLAGDTINGVKDVGKFIAEKGVGKALEAIVKGAEKLMSGALPRGKGFNDLFYGILDKLASAVSDWGGTSGKGVGPPGHIGKALKGFLNFAGKWAFPVAGPYTYNSGYPYGAHPSANYWHTGSDFDAKVGTPIVSMGPGKVMGVTNLGDRSYGRYVTIDYGTFQTLYAHMNAFAPGLHVGQSLKAGSPVGQVGWYGNVSPKSPAGAHLHLEASTRAAFGSMSNTFDPLELLRRLGFKFAAGGVVSPSDGGMLSIIGEAGKHERIEPLDREGFSKRDRAILDMIQALVAKGGGDQFIVNPSRGMDEMELASAVARRVQFRRRTGS